MSDDARRDNEQTWATVNRTRRGEPTLSTLDALMREAYMPAIREQFTTAPLFDRIERAPLNRRQQARRRLRLWGQKWRRRVGNARMALRGEWPDDDWSDW